ncbi:UPF0481 protein [Spatholobus suberectus]|nr:UPF0481 protein [Spatholobus suberectus]
MLVINVDLSIPKLQNFNQMEGQSSDSLSEQQCLETKLTKMLQNVEPPEMNELNKQCIYRVPHRIRETNPKAYTPRIVSIGPFHKARDVGKVDNILESMEELKMKYLKGFLYRTQIPIRQFVDELKRLEESIRSCYAAPIEYNSDDFLKMILIDACFIIEIFLRWHSCEDWEGKDPLLLKPWMLQDIGLDLILLENQLPFFVLEQLYNFTGMNRVFPPFLKITFNYLKNLNPESVCPTELPMHFTDLLRSSMISSSTFHLEALEKCEEIKHLYSASQLSEAGLKFKADQNNCLVDLHYHEGNKEEKLAFEKRTKG